MTLLAPHRSEVDQIGALLARLDGVRPTGRGGEWLGRCPAHADTRPSLHVTVTADRILLYCRSHHCAAEDILAALGLTFSDLFLIPRRPRLVPAPARAPLSEVERARRDVVARADRATRRLARWADLLALARAQRRAEQQVLAARVEAADDVAGWCALAQAAALDTLVALGDAEVAAFLVAMRPRRRAVGAS